MSTNLLLISLHVDILILQNENKKTTISGQDGEEEMLTWSGPKKPPRSLVMYDREISVVQPVIRLPRRAIQRNWHVDVHSMTQ
jgi:hypothetical protein